MTIDGKTKTCGLIGNPVEHTMSPAIHNTLAELMGHNLVYVPFLVEQGNLEKAIAGAHALSIHGLNVTVPYKSEVLATLVDIDPLAKQIGAVNTLVKTEGGYKGYNTDMEGLYRALLSEGIKIEGEPVIILGAGGAARAVAFLCAHYGADKIYLLNRTVEKGISIQQEVNEAFSKDLVEVLPLSDYEKLPRKKMLAIQATSVGLAPNVNQVVIEDKGFYERVHTGYDLIYRPANTRFMQLCKEHGAKAYHGLKMLLYQGIIAYELWNQVQVTKEQTAVVYQKMKEAMNLEDME